MKTTLKRIFEETLAELRLEPVMRSRLRCTDGVLRIADEEIVLSDYKKIIALAIGKAAHPMARGFVEIAAPARVSGVIVGPTSAEKPPFFVEYVGGHPYPNAASFHAASVIEELLDDLNEKHLLVTLLSGGGSAICEKPVDPSISEADMGKIFEALVTCGADIVEMNVVRKHFSAIKGGRLAARAHPARQVTLYVSDVPADQPSSVASGPTMPDPSTVEECRAIVERLGIRDRLPESASALLDGAMPETPKPGAEAFERSSYHSLLDNSHALAAVERRANEAGWVLETDLSVDDLPVAEAAERLLARLDGLRAKHPDRTVAVLTGGELSSPVRGDGRGGRNQAFVLDCVDRIEGRPIAVISAGTDGVDGNSPGAGALADGTTAKRGRELGMEAAEFAERSDSYSYFERLGDVLEIGPTGNNVRDVRLLVCEPDAA